MQENPIFFLLSLVPLLFFSFCLVSPDNIDEMEKVPIDTLPVELRIKIYELGDVSTISTGYVIPWARTILMSGILNDKDAIEIAAIQEGKPRWIMCNYIAYSGNLPMIQWARSYKPMLMSGTLNDKDVIAMKRGKSGQIMCNYIANSSNVSMVKWVRSDEVPRKDDADATEQSMKQIRLAPFPWYERTCRNAARFGHLKLLQWLHKQGCPWNCRTRSDEVPRKDDATEEPSMKQFRLAPFPWSEQTCCNAAKFGHFKLLKWLREQGCRWSHRTFSDAATFGNIEMLEWLYQMKCPWDSETFTAAARFGHFDVLKWLHEHQCPWDEHTFTAAVRTGNLEMVEWLHENCCKKRTARGLKVAP
jgi:hypothetical protein